MLIIKYFITDIVIIHSGNNNKRIYLFISTDGNNEIISISSSPPNSQRYIPLTEPISSDEDNDDDDDEDNNNDEDADDEDSDDNPNPNYSQRMFYFYSLVGESNFLSASARPNVLVTCFRA